MGIDLIQIDNREVNEFSERERAQNKDLLFRFNCLLNNKNNNNRTKKTANSVRHDERV